MLWTVLLYKMIFFLLHCLGEAFMSAVVLETHMIWVSCLPDMPKAAMMHYLISLLSNYLAIS